MGIRNLTQFLNKKGLIKEIPLKEFSGKRIAIDCSNLFYKIKAVIISEEQLMYLNFDTLEVNEDVIIQLFLRNLKIFIRRWIKLKIIPVFVFDGTSPSEKNKTIMIRQNKRKINRDIINAIKEKNDRSIDDISIFIDSFLQSFDIEKERDAALELINEIKLPYYLSFGEAEKLCSALCIEEKVYAVFSADSDNLAYGCTRLIIGNGKNKDTVLVIEYNEVLNKLNISSKTFLDLCIMSGCDYNTNIKGIGIIGSYNLLTKHNSIDFLPEKYNIDILDHIKCRSMFSYQKSSLLYDVCYEGKDDEIIKNFYS